MGYINPRSCTSEIIFGSPIICLRTASESLEIYGPSNVQLQGRNNTQKNSTDLGTIPVADI